MAEVAIHRIARIKLVGSATITLANEFPGVTFNTVDDYTVLCEPTFGSFFEVSKSVTEVTITMSASPPGGNTVVILTHKM